MAEGKEFPIWRGNELLPAAVTGTVVFKRKSIYWFERLELSWFVCLSLYLASSLVLENLILLEIKLTFFILDVCEQLTEYAHFTDEETPAPGG